jgi:hypothetical protein
MIDHSVVFDLLVVVTTAGSTFFLVIFVFFIETRLRGIERITIGTVLLFGEVQLDIILSRVEVTAVL